MTTEPFRLLPLLLLAACPAEPKETGEAPSVCDGEPIALTDANNYTFAGALDVPSLVTASGTDVTVCWDELAQDIQCHDLDPAADIDVVGMVRFGSLTQDEVEAGLSTNSLQQSEMSGYVQVENTEEGTCASLSQMSFFGTEIDVAAEYVEGGGTFMLLLTTGTTLGVGARMLAFLEPSAASSETTASVPDGCGILDFTVDLHTPEAAPACADGPYTVDWSAVSTDGQGNAFDPGQIDQLMLGYYEGAAVADIEADFLDLEANATRLWTMELSGETSADLTLASDGSSGFGGFDGDGVWLLALRCSRCYNPAPLVVAVLEPGMDH